MPGLDLMRSTAVRGVYGVNGVSTQNARENCPSVNFLAFRVPAKPIDARRARPWVTASRPEQAASNNNKEDIMIIRKIRQLFKSRHVGHNGKSKPHSWIEDPFAQQAVLVDRDTGRVLGITSHDGYGKLECEVFVSPWHAFQLARRNDGFLVSLRPFPRVIVELVRLKTEHMTHAKRYVEDMLGLDRND